MVKKAATKTVVESTVETPAPTKVDTETKVEEPVVEVVADVVSPLAELAGKIGAFAGLLKETQAALKVLTKEYDRMRKLVEKTERKRANARTSPSGFAKPTKISDEMCVFLEVEKGTEMSRTDVTRRINSYVKANNLNDPANKRIINPDPKLRKILGVEPEKSTSYFELQKHIKVHFIK